MKKADQELVDAIRGGDQAAFEALYNAHFRRIQNFATRRLGDACEAEDVTQEVFAAVFNCLDRFQGKSELIVWIFGITRNILNNRLRRRGAIRLVALEDAPRDAMPRDPGPENQISARRTLSRVSAAMERLPGEQRRILELRHGEQLPIRRIAEITHRSEDAVKSSLYRARRSLSSELPDAGLV